MEILCNNDATFKQMIAGATVPQSWAELVEHIKTTARKCKRDGDREYRGSYLRPRELQVLACNNNGRVDRCEPIFNNVSKLTGKWLREQVRYIKEHYPDATLVGIDGGFDLFESFQDYLAGFDYEPCIEVWEVEVPKALFDSA